jgi:hypothetical protein
MNDTAFATRVGNIARAAGLSIKDNALASIAADLTAQVETDAPSSAIARELRELRKARPFCFESVEGSHS